MKKVAIGSYAVSGLVAGFLFHNSAMAQTPDFNPVTSEYLAGHGLATINADVAYRLGWNGHGTTVAVVDTGILTTHREFIGKLPSFGQLILNTRPWSPVHDNHGTHVAGTVAARKDNLGMHGVAYGANLVPIYVELMGNKVPNPGPDRTADAWRAVLNRPDITVINNSWGGGFHLEELTTPQEIADARGEVEHLLAVAPALRDANKLVVMATGNDSFVSPSATAALPFFDPSLKNNFLSVVAFNPERTVRDIDFIADFSNLAQGAEDYSLVAPGVGIVSAGTISNTSYTTKRGTSMAAPHVSGAAAVVQSAFRWMGGKELADVLLSTTNRDYSAVAPVMITSDVIYGETATNFVFFDAARYAVASQTDLTGDYTPAALAAQNAILNDYCTAKGYSTQRCDLFKNSDRFTLDASANPEQVFGQGILDLGKAIGGLGFIDGQRMADDDFDVGLGAGLYRVDTKGYSGLWSNNIGEQRATAGVLNGQPLGLRKQGAGTLVLSGINSYRGPTVAEGGMLTLTGSIAGDALIRPNGAFGGNGIVGGNLDNQGLLVAGLPTTPGSALTVSNAVSSTGTIVIPVQENQAGRLQADTMTLNGGVVTAVASSGFLRPNSRYSGVLNGSRGLTINNGFSHIAKASPFLEVITAQSGHQLDLSIKALPLAGGTTLNGDNRPVASALDRMFAQRDGSPEQRHLDGFYSLSEEGLAEVTTNLQGNSHAETLVMQPAAAMVNGVVLNHLNQIDATQGLSAGDTTPFTRASAWGQVLGGIGRVKGTETLRSTLYGAVGGYDVPLDDRWLVGGLAGFSRGRVRQGSSNVDINDIRFGLYTRFADAGWSVHGLVTAGYQHYDSTRGLLVPGAAATAKSRFSGYSVGGSVDAGYDVLYGHSHRFSLRPYLGFDVGYTHQNSRKEDGAGLYNLNLERSSVTQTALRPGVTFGYALGSQVNLSLSAGYRRVLSGDTASIGATLVGDASQTRFNSVGRGAGRDFATLGIGLAADLKNGWEGEANVNGELSSRSQNIAGTLSLRYRW